VSAYYKSCHAACVGSILSAINRGAHQSKKKRQTALLLIWR